MLLVYLKNVKCMNVEWFQDKEQFEARVSVNFASVSCLEQYQVLPRGLTGYAH